MKYTYSLCLAACMFCLCNFLYAQAIPVKIVETSGGYQLLRGGAPYYVKGAGGSTYLDEVLEAGGNSIRTWSADEASKILDEAHEKGLTVMFGLWVGHERHGFNYDDELAVKKQLERFTGIVKKYKDHPAILLWGIGNEVDLFYTNTKVWKAIQDIAKMIHELDPNHPTTTVTAGLDPEEVRLIMKDAPDIDIYSVNTYGDIGKVPGNIKAFGWNGPFMITEWGPTGHWEVEQTAWGVPFEQSSKEKAESYRTRFKNYIKAYSSTCVGSYVFLWGQKQETTSTWYGIFTKNGERTETFDAIYEAWRGSLPENRAPSLDSVLLNGFGTRKDIYLEMNKKYEAAVFISSNGSKTKFTWEVFPESTDIKAGGDLEAEPDPIYQAVKKRKENKIIVKAPKEEGAYRLFVYAKNEHGKVAYANLPFYVTPTSGGNTQTGLRIKPQELNPSYR